jgi:hypothetical protein
MSATLGPPGPAKPVISRMRHSSDSEQRLPLLGCVRGSLRAALARSEGHEGPAPLAATAGTAAQGLSYVPKLTGCSPDGVPRFSYGPPVADPGDFPTHRGLWLTVASLALGVGVWLVTTVGQAHRPSTNDRLFAVFGWICLVGFLGLVVLALAEMLALRFLRRHHARTGGDTEVGAAEAGGDHAEVLYQGADGRTLRYSGAGAGVPGAFSAVRFVALAETKDQVDEDEA